MAKPKRKAPKGKPVTQHQLFPAVVALWFGALFGLGSLAVRPSLLEELVIRSRIDLLVPAAAPPLGMTARMLVALAMAALGAMIGTLIARRIARSKQEVRERKRTNLSTRDEGAEAYSNGVQTDASTRNPGPAGDGFAETATADANRAHTSRRRSLAIEHEANEFVPHDMAPLPGGTPQIFDIASAGLNDALPSELPPPTAGFVEPAPAPGPVALDWANAAPVLPPAASAEPASLPQAIEAQRQQFQQAESVNQLQAAPADTRQVFGMAPPLSSPADQPRQIFGAPVTGDHVAKEFLEAQGFGASVFEAPQPSPLFVGRGETAPAAAEPDQAPLPAAIPEAYVPPADNPAPISTMTPPPAAAEAVSPSPASPGIEDLSARLAESMRRRRASRADKAAVTEPAATASPAPVPQAFEPAHVAPNFQPVSVSPAGPSAAPETIPAALRPLDLTGFEEDDLATNDTLPPRRIAMPAAPIPQAFVPPVASTGEDEPEVVEESAVAEENYASLLAVSASPASLRNPFVRVEEAETDPETVEPVVIFPGQAIPAAANGQEDSVPFRRFDAPANAEQGQPVVISEMASALPPEETEHALRAALANLQRMSGAA